jgi:hypothetical protein
MAWTRPQGFEHKDGMTKAQCRATRAEQLTKTAAIKKHASATSTFPAQYPPKPITPRLSVRATHFLEDMRAAEITALGRAAPADPRVRDAPLSSHEATPWTPLLAASPYIGRWKRWTDWLAAAVSGFLLRLLPGTSLAWGQRRHPSMTAPVKH